jgi:tetratricopeptide (TPR) repeat protein
MTAEAGSNSELNSELNSEPIELVEQDLQLGQRAFESGQYRSAVQAFEQALGAAAPGSLVHGEVMIWLVTAYEAAGDRELARSLCKVASKHPQWDIRKEGKRLLYILNAPILRQREDWQTKIPDLEALEPKTDGQKWGAPQSPTIRPPRPAPPPPGYQIAPPTDPNLKTEDPAFVWVVLGAIGVMLAGLAWVGVAGG